MSYKSTKRIVIVGPAGAGKTTLVKVLKQKYKIHYIPEQARIICNKLGYKSIYKIENPNDFRFMVLQAQIKLEEKYKEFISDRSTIDCWIHWLYWSAASATTNQTERYYALARTQALQYSKIIYLPLNIQLKNDGFRWNNKEYQSQLHRLFITTLHGWQVMHKTHIVQSKKLKERLKEVSYFIKN